MEFSLNHHLPQAIVVQTLSLYLPDDQSCDVIQQLSNLVQTLDLNTRNHSRQCGNTQIIPSPSLEYRMASKVDKSNQSLIPQIAKPSVCRYMAFPLTWPAKYFSPCVLRSVRSQETFKISEKKICIPSQDSHNRTKSSAKANVVKYV